MNAKVRVKPILIIWLAIVILLCFSW